VERRVSKEFPEYRVFDPCRNGAPGCMLSTSFPVVARPRRTCGRPKTLNGRHSICEMSFLATPFNWRSGTADMDFFLILPGGIGVVLHF